MTIFRFINKFNNVDLKLKIEVVKKSILTGKLITCKNENSERKKKTTKLLVLIVVKKRNKYTDLPD
jgi:hypothetical protein